MFKNQRVAPGIAFWHISCFHYGKWTVTGKQENESGRQVMQITYARFWWSFVFRGIIAVLFGLAAILLPGITLDILVLLVGAFFFVDGLMSIVSSFGSMNNEERWWLSLLEGLAGVLIGVITFLWPGVTLVAVVLMIAAWALITGFFEIMAAIRLRRVISGEWFLAGSGMISILFGLVLLVNPGVGAVALVWILGIYAVFFGILLLFLGFKLKRVLQRGQ